MITGLSVVKIKGRKALSTTWPWTLGLTPDEIVRRAVELGCSEICIRAVDGKYLYGINAWTRVRWSGKDHRDLAEAARKTGLTISIWCAVYLKNPTVEAETIKDAVELYDPSTVFIDAEAQAKKNIQRLASFVKTSSGLPAKGIVERIITAYQPQEITAQSVVSNLRPFLQTMGRLSCKVYLQTYRRADLHWEMQWLEWWKAKTQSSEYIIDGLAHQLYPIGWDTPEDWVSDFKRSTESHQVFLDQAGRPNLEWLPTLPTFIAGSYEGVPGWRPTPQAFISGLEYLADTLNERLVGVNLWSYDQDLHQLPSLQETIRDHILVIGDVPPPGPPVVPIPQWAPELDEWARVMGYTGPRPPSP